MYIYFDRVRTSVSVQQTGSSLKIIALYRGISIFISFVQILRDTVEVSGLRTPPLPFGLRRWTQALSSVRKVV